MRASTFILILTLASQLYSCKSLGSQSAAGAEKAGSVIGYLSDLSGVDGCGWVIRLEKKLPDGTEKLEPVNLNAFEVQLKEGQKVRFTYHECAGASVCMVGKIVEIETITEN